MPLYPTVADRSDQLADVTAAGVSARVLLGVVARHLPPYVVVDARDQIVQFSGAAIGEYLDPRQGDASLGIYDLLHASLHETVRKVVRRAVGTGHGAARRETVFDPDGQPRLVRVIAEPLAHAPPAGAAADAPLLMILFDRQTNAAELLHGGDPIAPVVGLAEYQMLVEELRSANEELQAARDDMQAAHEELHTVNAELSSKNQTLACLNNDFRNLLDSTQIATLFLDADLRVRTFTPNIAELFALRRGDIGRPVTDLRARVDYAEMADDVSEVLRSGDVVEREIRAHDRARTVYLMRMHPLRPAQDGSNGVVVTFVDITARKRAEDRVLFLAHHDALTGLANRVVFNATLDRTATFAGLLYLDLDRFKPVNDAFGHKVGDELLRMVADRLRRCVRTGDVVCRLGGDEFAIIQQIREPADATALATRIIAAVSAPYDVDGIAIRIGVSVGIALRAAGRTDAEVLARSADIALYAAKARGRGNYQVFDPLMQRKIEERRGLESDLGSALARDEFTILLQPLVRLSDRAVTGAEALLRWRHPLHGLLAPAVFIPLAEESGTILPIGSWVVRSACAQAAAWPDPIQVCVNLSSCQFADPALLETIQGALIDAGLPAHRLTLELTESVLLRDESRTQSRLRALRNLGVKIALDDFGTGYSSLSYLHSFAVDQIKIDRTFTQTLDSRKESSLIVRAVVEIAKGLDVTVCAEGAETDGQLDALYELGVYAAQGFRLYSPMAASEFSTAVFAAHRH